MASIRQRIILVKGDGDGDGEGEAAGDGEAEAAGDGCFGSFAAAQAARGGPLGLTHNVNMPLTPPHLHHLQRYSGGPSQAHAVAWFLQVVQRGSTDFPSDLHRSRRSPQPRPQVPRPLPFGPLLAGSSPPPQRPPLPCLPQPPPLRCSMTPLGHARRRQLRRRHTAVQPPEAQPRLVPLAPPDGHQHQHTVRGQAVHVPPAWRQAPLAAG